MEAFLDNPAHLGRYSGPVRGKESGPYLFDEEALRGKQHLALAPPTGRFGGPLWYNSLYWPNFPPLGFLSDDSDLDFQESLRAANPDGPLADQYVTFGAAREHLCQHGRMPQEPMTLMVEVMQYDGVYDNGWHFPLQDFIPKRGHHTPYDVQSRRGFENGAMALGLNAEDFSDSVLPVSDLPAVVTVTAEPPRTRLRAVEGHQFALLSIGGWPFRIRRVGTFEGLGHGGRLELQLGSGEFSEEVLWQLLEGGKTASGGHLEEVCARSGCKYWCQLYDLDWLGPKRDEHLAIDPEIPLQKGYVWFRVLERTELPETGRRAVRVQLLEDGVVPAWLDLRYLQVWAGDMPLGYLNKVFGDEVLGRARVLRTLQDGADDRGVREVHIRNAWSNLVFKDPLCSEGNDLVDLGWALHGIGYRPHGQDNCRKLGFLLIHVMATHGYIASFRSVASIAHVLSPQMALSAEPAPPKKPGSAYMLWLKENRARIAGSLGEDGKKVTLVSKAAGAEWKTLSDKVKKPFVDMAAKLKADFLAEKEAFEKQGGVMPARKSKKAAAKAAKTKDPSLPKRPHNAYMLWLQDHRKEITDALGPGHQPKQVMVEAGKRWRMCSDAEKGPYVAQASELKQAYNKQRQGHVKL
ncbi:HMGB13 [Symbiodinium sp. CCMP2456]|nr:HMGB13 [Symbiodinium sp. CCMP2456]